MRKVSAAHALLEAYKERLQRANEAMLRAFQVRGRGEGKGCTIHSVQAYPCGCQGLRYRLTHKYRKGAVVQLSS